MSAQIQRTVAGLTLGVTTKNDVRKRFGFSSKAERDYFFVSQVQFAGQNWSALLSFYNEKLYKVEFLISTAHTHSPLAIKLKESLNKKYSQYLLSSDTNKTEFSDNKTIVVLRDYETVSLSYTDIYLTNKKEEDAEDEL